MAATSTRPGAETPMLEVKDLSICFHLRPPTTLKGEMMRRFGGNQPRIPKTEFWALKDVSFTLYEGDSLGIVGDNGAGKSSLLKLIVGIYPPTDGVITYSGSMFPLLQTGLGFDMELTGDENVFLSMAWFGLSKKQVRPLLDQVFEFSELQEFRDQPLKTYSTGMISRLGFTLSTMVVSDILVLDEVFASGDIHWVGKALKRLEHRMASSKMLLMVSHSMHTIRQYCNKCLWLAHGKTADFGGLDVVDRYEAHVGKGE